MPRDFYNEHLTFSLDPRHDIIIRDAKLIFGYMTNGIVTFHAADNHRHTIAYQVSELNRMNRAGEITVIPYGLLPADQRPIPVCDQSSSFLAGLSKAHLDRIAWRYAMVRGFLELNQQGAVIGTDLSISENMQAICDAATPYFQDVMVDPEHSAQLQAWEAGHGRKPRMPLATSRPNPCSPRALRGWIALYKKGGKAALADRGAKQGNSFSRFSTEELGLLGKVVRSEFMTLQRKSQAAVVQDVKIQFRAENKRRAAEGLPTLRVPGRDAVRGFIRRIDTFSVLIARYGVERALQKMRPVKDGVQVSRPFERVEMDEQKIDLISILAQSGLLELFTTEELNMLGLLDRKKRWWLVLAIDCRTRCILGMTLTCNPRASAALKCLRMVVSDKGQFADRVGALAPWSIAGRPETLVTDNGAAFKARVFTSACTDLGITAIQAIGGAPGMRGRVERVFGTLSTTLMSRLAGYTFSNVLDRGDVEAENRACIQLEDLCIALVRWGVDVYHNAPHEGLGGLTPLQQWEADLREGNVPLHTVPNTRSKHIALGVGLSRMLQKDGIRVMNVQYHSRALAEFFFKHGKQSLEVRWNEEDLGTIEVNFDGGWQTVPSSVDAFRGVHASNWLKACRSLKATDPKRKEWEADVVAQAIRDIEAMNARAMTAFHILDHAWTAERLAKVEAEALASFSTVPTREKTSNPADGRGRVIIPIAPADLDADAVPINPYQPVTLGAVTSGNASSSESATERNAPPKSTPTAADESEATKPENPVESTTPRRGRKKGIGFRFPE
jgi:putative transposase